jgi:hypothetical protein
LADSERNNLLNSLARTINQWLYQRDWRD